MSDIVAGYTFVDGEKGITATKLNNIVGGATIQTDFYANKPAGSALNPTDQLLELTSGGTYARITGAQLSSSVAGQLTLANTSQPGMLCKVSGNTTDIIDGTNSCVPFASSPAFGFARLRNFNALAWSNCTFEVDQRNCGNVLTNVGSGAFLCDRWILWKGGTWTINSQKQGSSGTSGSKIPGTQFFITGAQLTLSLTAQQTSLGAGDVGAIVGNIEGPMWRELQGDVHSISLLVNSTVAPLHFSVSIRDPGTSTKSFCHLCTIPTANVVTLITIPNIPVFPAGNFTNAPGSAGYQISICLGAGSTYTAASADSWVSGNFVAAPGTDNWFSNPVNSTFWLIMMQHEPGPVASQFMDLDFQTNLSRCQRYFVSSYDFGTKPGTATLSGAVNFYAGAASSPTFYTPFKQTMAKVPTMTGYSPATGAANNVRDYSAGADKAISNANNTGINGFSGFTVSSPNGALWNAAFHYTADTGW